MPTGRRLLFIVAAAFIFRAKYELSSRGRFALARTNLKTNEMKRIRLHLQAYALLAPCLLAFTDGCLWANAAGAAYIAGLAYVCSHTETGKRFARAYYREVLRLERFLQTNNF